MRKIFIFLLLFIVIGTSHAYAMADSAFSACVINQATGEVIWHKNGYEKHPMASTTKIMTAIIALENCSIYDVVKISKKAQNTEGSSMYIREGEEYIMHDILYGLMLNSGNDAAIAIAEHIAKTPEAFADMMNKKAYELGARNTQFMNPNGLDDDGHYTTAYDLAIIARYALKNEAFKEIVSTKYREVRAQNGHRLIPLVNHNKLLSRYNGCTGIKTGYTKKTGRCLVSSAQRDGMEFVAVTLGDKNDWESHTQMLDYCFDTHRPVYAVKAGSCARIAKIHDDEYKLLYKDSLCIPLNNDSSKILVENHINPDLTNGINAGEKVGYARITQNDIVIDTVDIISEKEIPPCNTYRLRKSFFSILDRTLKNLLF